MHFLSSPLPHTSCFPGFGDLSSPSAKTSIPDQALPPDPPSIGQQKRAALTGLPFLQSPERWTVSRGYQQIQLEVSARTSPDWTHDLC